jgi:hypothetical protein
VDGGDVIPGDGFHLVDGNRVLGIAGRDHHAEFRPARAKLLQHGGQDRFVASVAKAVVADQKDHLVVIRMSCCLLRRPGNRRARTAV